MKFYTKKYDNVIHCNILNKSEKPTLLLLVKMTKKLCLFLQKKMSNV